MRSVATLALFVIAAAFAALAVTRFVLLSEARDLWATGRTTQGIVVDKGTRRKSNLAEYSYTYRVDGKEYRRDRRVTSKSAGELPVGSAVEVRYDPADPVRALTQGERDESEDWTNQAVLPLISAGLFAWAIARLRGARRPAPPRKRAT